MMFRMTYIHKKNIHGNKDEKMKIFSGKIKKRKNNISITEPS